MQARISLITLGVSDLARARDFYSTGLGFPIMPHSNDSVVFLGLNGLWLSLYSRDALADDAQISSQGQGFAGFSLAHNVRSREEVIAVLAQAQSAGAKIVKPAQEAFWGGFSGYFTDPDGFLWEVAWNPHFWIE